MSGDVPAMYFLSVRVIVWALLGMLALCVLPMLLLVFAGLIRRFQMWRTRRELDRLGFVGSERDQAATPLVWRLFGVAIVGSAALFIATVVLPGPPAGQILASTDGSSIAGTPTHSAVSPDTGPATHHPASQQPPSTHGGTQSSPASSSDPTASPAAHRRSGDAGAPATVSALPASATAIQLQWAPVTGAARYAVERSTDAASWETVHSIPGGTTAYTDAALDSGTTYFYRIAAVLGGSQDVLRSDVVSATTTVDTPAAPVLVSATPSDTSVALVWDDVVGEDGYHVQRSADGANWADIATTGQDITSYTDNGLAPATTFYYRVIAVTGGASSDPSAPLPATTDVAAPSTSDANAPSIAPTVP